MSHPRGHSEMKRGERAEGDNDASVGGLLICVGHVQYDEGLCPHALESGGIDGVSRRVS